MPEEEEGLAPVPPRADNGTEAQKPLYFPGMEVLAPMVRASTLPLRLQCLRYGADLVYGEEIVDKKFIGCERVENTAFGLVDFVSPREKVAVFSTCAEERSRVIFQMGTADAALATQAALVVCNDVRGIDINMGCPKSFSVKGGMGAALMATPEIAADILKTLRRNLPSSCALTCKIRMLPDAQKTREYMQLCERSGAEAIAVHMRLREERPVEPAHWNEIVKLWDAVKVPVLANGDFFTRRQIEEFWKHLGGEPGAAGVEDPAARWQGPSGLMIARGAMWDPSIFCRPGVRVPPPFEEVVKSYTRLAVSSNSTYQNTKWVLNTMLAGGTGVTPPSTFNGEVMKHFNRKVGAAKTMAAICALVGEPFEAAAMPPRSHTTMYYRGEAKAAAGVGKAATAGARPPAEEADAEGEEAEGGPLKKRRRDDAADGGAADGAAEAP